MTQVAKLTPIDQVQESLKQFFPDMEIVVRKADDPNGFHFLNVFCGDLEVAVEWKQDRGFGLSCFQSDDDALEGAYDTPDEWFKNPDAVFHRIASLILDQQTTRCPSSTIPEMRHDRKMSQENLSALLAVTQATYSKMERRDDMLVSSLRKVVESMGGILRIEARFPNSQDVREIKLQ